MKPDDDYDRDYRRGYANALSGQPNEGASTNAYSAGFRAGGVLRVSGGAPGNHSLDYDAGYRKGVKNAKAGIPHTEVVAEHLDKTVDFRTGYGQGYSDQYEGLGLDQTVRPAPLDGKN